MNNIESLSRLTKAVETAKADIFPTDAESVQLAFAIATDCGDAGREFFHRLYQLSPQYSYQDAERLFAEALATEKSEVHLQTAFLLAEKAGVKLPKGEDEDSEMPKSLPTFPAASWPQLLNNIIDCASDPTQRDMMLLGALTALGATMEHHVQCLYNGNFQSPCLQSFIVTKSFFDTNLLSIIRPLVEPIHEEMHKQVDKKMAVYRQEMVGYNIMGRARATMKRPQAPDNKIFLIANDIPRINVFQDIIDAGGKGFVFETEANSLSASIRPKYNEWRNTLRIAFDHSRLCYYKGTKPNYWKTQKTYLSVLLSGSQNQIKEFIPSGKNGFLLRELFYCMPDRNKWMNLFDKNNKNLEEDFEKMGWEWKKQVDQLKAHGIHTLKLTDRQIEAFNKLFSELLSHSLLTNNDELGNSLVNLAINICRILSEVAVLRILENPHPYDFKEGTPATFTPAVEVDSDKSQDGTVSSWEFTINDDDFKAVLGLTIPLYEHTMHLLPSLFQEWD